MRYLCPKEGRTRLGNLRYLEQLTPLARNNRKKMTETENLMWELIRKNRLGWKFIKQKPIGRFILDFYCSKLMLAVEIDGEYHKHRENYDNGRDELLSTYGVMTIRYTSQEVLMNLLEVERDLQRIIGERAEDLFSLPLVRGRELERRVLKES